MSMDGVCKRHVQGWTHAEEIVYLGRPVALSEEDGNIQMQTHEYYCSIETGIFVNRATLRGSKLIKRYGSTSSGNFNKSIDN